MVGQYPQNFNIETGLHLNWFADHYHLLEDKVEQDCMYSITQYDHYVHFHSRDH